MAGAMVSDVQVSATCPKGKYNGTWGGYVVRWKGPGGTYQGKTDVGIRTPSASCIVTVDEIGITVELKASE